MTNDQRQKALEEIRLIRWALGKVKDEFIASRANAPSVDAYLKLDLFLKLTTENLLDDAGETSDDKRNKFLDQPASGSAGRSNPGKLTIQEHWQLGWRLFAIRTAIFDQEEPFSDCPVSGDAPKRFRSAQLAIDNLRKALDELFRKHYPGEWNPEAFSCTSRYERLVIKKNIEWREALTMGWD